ncbi:hypothetical protein BTVI_39991 [Pitangus sulphuratus]|nr:hypothetical protein BTVI_39991 [Pitangus sulphuratus]
MEWIHSGAIHEELQAVGETGVGEIHGGLSPMERPHAGAKEEFGEEGASETMYAELIASPVPNPPVLPRGEAEEGTDRVTLGGSWCPAKVNSPQGDKRDHIHVLV